MVIASNRTSSLISPPAVYGAGKGFVPQPVTANRLAAIGHFLHAEPYTTAVPLL